jgi:hypothetical protein
VTTVSVFHLKKRDSRNRLSNKATHRLATMTLDPVDSIALEILQGSDPDLEYEKVARVFIEDGEPLPTAYAKTQNQRGIWNEKLDPKSEYLGGGHPRSSTIGDALIVDGVVSIVSVGGFQRLNQKFYED